MHGIAIVIGIFKKMFRSLFELPMFVCDSLQFNVVLLLMDGRDLPSNLPELLSYTVLNLKLDLEKVHGFMKHPYRLTSAVSFSVLFLWSGYNNVKASN